MGKDTNIENEALKVLILEDSLQDMELMVAQLSDAGYQLDITHAENKDQFIVALEKNCCDIVLSDFKLPGFDAFGALEISQEFCPEVPFICVSGSIGEEKAIELLKQGAVDYVLKDRPDRLPFAVQHAIEKAKEKAARFIAARELKENYDLIRIAGEKVKLGGWNVLLKENRSYWSDEVAAIHEMPAGYSPQVEDGINFYAPEWRDKITEVYSKCVQEGIPYDEEMEIITASGKRVWVRTIGEAVRDENGNIFKIQGAFQDITLKKQTEKELKNSEARYKAIFESTGTATLIVDEDTTILMANNECLNITGYTSTELIGQKWTQYVAPESLQEMLKNQQLRSQNPELAPQKYEAKLLNSKSEKRDAVLDVNIIPETRQSVVSILDITEKKQAEEELLKSKSNLEEYFENDISADYVVAVSGEIFSCNKTFLNLFGFEEKSETEKFDITELYKNPEDRNQLIRLVKKQGKVENHEVEYVSKEGKTIYALINAIGIFGQDDELEKIRGYVVDITEQKNIEKELLKLSRAVEQSPTSIIITDVDGNAEYVNPKTLEITGYAKEELIGKNPRIFNSGEKPKDDYQQLWSALLSGREWTGEFHNKKKNGELYWESASISPIINEKQEVINFVAVKEDITERKRFEGTQKLLLEISELATKHVTLTSFLAEVHQKLKQIVRADNFYVALYNDTDHTFSFPYHVDKFDKLELNKPYDFSKGFTDYVLKTNKSLIVTPEYEDKIEKEGIVKIYGDELSVWLGVPFQTKEGQQPNGVIAIQDYQNVESYTETDRSIMEIIAHHIGRFIERIQHLEELIRAKEKAEESDRLKSAFLANMSHEIRTPMNGILGFTELLLEPDLSSEEKEDYINIVNQSGQRMLNTVNDLMEISKIEAGIVTVNLKEVNVQEILLELIRFFTPEAAKKGLQLTLENEVPETAFVTTDKSKLDSILTNLIKNAIKYTNSGSIKVGCETIETHGHASLQFYVKDTGIGIPEERQQAIFERFVQADIATTRQFDGSGLGLAITKAYVEMLGGKIGLESKAGEGSTFFFSLPLRGQNMQRTEEKEPVKQEDITSPTKGLHILIAEDDGASAHYLKAILRKGNHKILLTQNGHEAVEACRNNPDVDLVLMDIQMPGMNGYDASREIRKFNKQVVIIAQTAFAISSDKEKALEAGCNDYLSKPITKEVLLEKIQEWTQG